MMTEQRQELLETLFLSSTQIDDLIFECTDGTVRIQYFYECGDDNCVGGLEFPGARAYRHRAESHCTVWHIDAYDSLVEVENSEWVAELVEAMSPDLRGLFEMHHYMIYFDSSGCYEVVAAAWRFLPEERRGGGEE